MKIWDLRTYQEIRTFEGRKSLWVCSLAVSLDKGHILSGDISGLVELWCFNTGKLLFRFEGHTSEISCVAIMSDGLRALSASSDGTLRVWKIEMHMRDNKFHGTVADVTDIALARNGSMCVSASADDTFKIWKCETAERRFTLKGDLVKARCVAVSVDGRYVVTLSSNCLSSLIKVWDLHDGSEIDRISCDGTAGIVRFSSDGLQVIIGCESYCVFIWDWKKRGASFERIILPAFRTVELACEGNMVYTCSRNMHVCEIDVGSLKASTFRPGIAMPVVLPNGKALLYGTLQDNLLVRWVFSTGCETQHDTGHCDDSIVTAIDITSNGKLALTGSSSGTLSLVDLESFQKSRTFQKTEPQVGIRFVCILRDDIRFVFVDEVNRIERRTFDGNEAGLELGKSDVEVTCITALGLKFILLGCANGQWLWFQLSGLSQGKYPADVDAISQVKSKPGDFSRHFVLGSFDGWVKLWSVEDFTEPRSIWSHKVSSDPISAIAFLPDSEDVIICSGEQVYRINGNGIVHEYCCSGNRVEALRVVDDTIFGVVTDVEGHFANSVLHLQILKWTLKLTTSAKILSPFGEKVLRINDSSNQIGLVGDDCLVIRNFKSGECLHRLPIYAGLDGITALAFVAGGDFLLTSGDNMYNYRTLSLRKLLNGECVEEFYFDQGVQAIACASNGIVCVGLRGGRVCFLRFNSISSPSVNEVKKASTEELPEITEEEPEKFKRSSTANAARAGITSAEEESHESCKGHNSKKEVPKASVKKSHESCKWEQVSKIHKGKFEKLIEYRRKCPGEVTEIHGVRFCLTEEFLIGKGGQSNGVYVGLGTDGSEKAVKVFLKSTHGRVAEKEKELFKKYEAKNLTHAVRCWFFDDSSLSTFAFLIMELCEETLKNFVYRNSQSDLVKLAPDIIQQILKGLLDLHRPPDCILHRDIKPSNILRNVHGKWLLADFGIARVLSDDLSTLHSGEKGTEKWRAVESYCKAKNSDDPVESCSESGTSGNDNVRYKKKSDIQVTAMVAFYILTKGEHPFGDDEQQILTNLLEGNPVNLNMLDDHPLVKDLISWMLNHDPRDRPSAEEALQHPYLKKFVKMSHESWKWENVSETHKETFEKLIEHGKNSFGEIMEINGVRVCLNKKFLIGTGRQSDGVYVALGTDGSEKAVKLFLKATHGPVAEQERKLLKKCETKNLTNVVRYWFFDDTSLRTFAFLIMELCEETLESFVNHNSRDELVKRAPDIIQQILRGIADLHREPHSILHRDLHPSNILRNVHGEWLLADFGIGRILSHKTTLHSVERGTKNWRAVESCCKSKNSDDPVELCSESGTSGEGNEVRYKKESDIQVTGMVAFYILTKGEHPFGEREHQIRTNLLAANPVNLNMLEDHPFAKDLISWMLSHDPNDRPSAEEALQHPYLKSKEQRFSLLCGMGNEPHVKKNDMNSDVVKELCKDKTDWRTRIDSNVLKYLSYDKLKKIPFIYTSSWRDCLRLIRNIKEHWKDYPRKEPEATKVGDPLEFFLNLFPDLVLLVYKIARSRGDLKELSGLKEYFNQ